MDGHQFADVQEWDRYVSTKQSEEENRPTSPSPRSLFVGCNLDQNLFQCLQTCFILFFSSHLMGVIQSRAVGILIFPTNSQKVHITIQNLWFDLTFLMQVFITNHEMKQCFCTNSMKRGRWKISRDYQLSGVCPEFSGDKKSVTIVFLLNIYLNLQL